LREVRRLPCMRHRIACQGACSGRGLAEAYVAHCGRCVVSPEQVPRWLGARADTIAERDDTAGKRDRAEATASAAQAEVAGLRAEVEGLRAEREELERKVGGAGAEGVGGAWVADAASLRWAGLGWRLEQVSVSRRCATSAPAALLCAPCVPMCAVPGYRSWPSSQRWQSCRARWARDFVACGVMARGSACLCCP
jgi:hypothetical protein